MQHNLTVYNSLTGKKEKFEPINAPNVGMYVCGPTVYSDVHLGNCLTFTKFDIIYRYLCYLGYNVRYVRNITDVGHLTDDGEDRMSKGAKANQLEPMEVAQKYTNGFHDMMRAFNNLSPSIEPRATGHILEQIEMVQQILDNGYAYVQNGSVYFDTIKFAEKEKTYGQLSGRILDDLLANTRDDLKNQSEKKNPADFAIWVKASDEHIMRWNSPWSVGFPGWHLECSAMSTKYLGKHFDIHGGGNDLKFPHHENEIAQNVGACSCQPAKYWLHTNMLLMNGRKMSKSDGNTIEIVDLFSGNSPHISKGYSPMVVRFFMLQSHYRSTVDMSDSAFLAAEKGYRRLMEAIATLASFETKAKEDGDLGKAISTTLDQAFADMNDDFNTPKALANCFELVTKINGLKDGLIPMEEVSASTLARLKQSLNGLVFDVFGLKNELDTANSGGSVAMDKVMDMVIKIRQNARANKDWGTADLIRDGLKDAGIQLKDGKDGTNWTVA